MELVEHVELAVDDFFEFCGVTVVPVGGDEGVGLEEGLEVVDEAVVVFLVLVDDGWHLACVCACGCY